jgi:hypothetical protein
MVMASQKAIELCKKIKALADKGKGGEQGNAQAMLTKFLKKYGLKIEDIESEHKKDRVFFFPAHNKLKGKFVQQVIASVLGSGINYWISNKKQQSDWIVKCTDAEYIEIKEKINFYWKHMQDEMDIFYKAFIQTNRLYSKPSADKQKAKELSREGLQELKRMSLMMQGMESKTLNKSLPHDKK